MTKVTEHYIAVHTADETTLVTSTHISYCCCCIKLRIAKVVLYETFPRTSKAKEETEESPVLHTIVFLIELVELVNLTSTHTAR